MTQLQQPIKFAYWVPNVSGGLVVVTSNSVQTGVMTTMFDLHRLPKIMVLNMRSPKFVLRQGTGQKTSMNL